MDIKLSTEEGLSLDLVQDNISQLGQLFPEVIKEGKVDFEALHDLLGNYQDTAEERYCLNWAGKADARREAQKRCSGTLRPCFNESKDWDSTENVYIEGDNLEVLKLLQKGYHGCIKMIYIDPPYNTGKDFIYTDNYKDNLENYLKQIGEDRSLSTKALSDSDGRFHSKWLNMMYPRLKLARNLLSEDGVIFISIDDGELVNLKKICDEVFGVDNYINTISVNMKNSAGASGGGEDKRLKKNCEFCLVYCRNYQILKPFSGVYDYTEMHEVLNTYRDEGKSWHYNSVLIDAGEKIYATSTVDGDGNEIRIFRRPFAVVKSINQIMADEGLSEKDVFIKYGTVIFEAKDAQSSIRTRIIEAKRHENIKDDVISIEYVPRSGKNRGKVYEQFYKGEKCRLFAWLRDISEVIDGVLYKKDVQGTYWDLTPFINNLSKEGDMQFPNGKKPIALIERMLAMVNDENSIILDFFSGSASTAHAVMQQNAKDEGKRKFIMVQLPEATDKDSEAYKAGFKNICEIGKERIRRAGNGIKEASPLTTQELDTGFRVYRLDSSNVKAWDSAPDHLEDALEQSLFNIKPERSDKDLLYELVLKFGLNLTVSFKEHEIAGKKVYEIGNGELIACLANGITNDVAEGIGKLWVNMKKNDTDVKCRVVFKDTGFYGEKGDEVKSNSILLLKQYGIDNVVTV